jgi:hypothetical protein
VGLQGSRRRSVVFGPELRVVLDRRLPWPKVQCRKSCDGKRRTKMASRQWLTGTAAAFAWAAMTGAAQSASLGSVVTDLRSDATTTVEQAQYRLCSMERGVRRCRSVEIYGPGRARVPRVYGYGPPGAAGVYGYQPPGPLVYGYQATAPVYGYQPLGPGVYGYQGIYRQYGYEYPDEYPVGSGAWWRSMNLTDRDGNSSNR